MFGNYSLTSCLLSDPKLLPSNSSIKCCCPMSYAHLLSRLELLPQLESPNVPASDSAGSCFTASSSTTMIACADG